MLRRLVPLTPLAPAAALILFVAANAAAEGRGQNALEDVQIGEAGKLLRIALICSEDCRVGARAGDVFFLSGVDADLDVDLEGRSVHARAIAVEPGQGGSILTLDTEEEISRASIKPCFIDGLAASCIDIEFAIEAAAVAAPSQKPVRPVEASHGQQTVNLTVPAPPQVRAASTPPAPVLREAPEERLLTFARFAPPERFAPPAAGGRPVILKERAVALVTPKFDVAEMAEAILGKTFGISECEGAQARLKTDAWALEAMVDVGFCAAIAGDIDKAEGVFTRLLAYTPDNYEALVGRALIAAKIGDRDAAKKHLQDALNALPPIEESDRIVEAMAKL
jgi:hypothetical protein